MQSKLMPLIEWVNENIDTTDLPNLIQHSLEFVTASTMQTRDKQKTLIAIKQIKDKQRLQLFLYNSMLKFNGFGVIKTNTL